MLSEIIHQIRKLLSSELPNVFETNEYSASPFESQYLGKCIQIAFSLNKHDILTNGLTASTVLIFVKSPQNPFSTKSTSKKLFSSALFNQNQNIPLRISSECLPGFFGDTECSCYTDTINYLKLINKNKSGIFVHLPQEAQGRGLREKVKDHRLIYGYNESGKKINPLSQETAMKILRPEGYDVRKYYVLKKIFKKLGLYNLSFEYLGESHTKMELIKKQSGLKLWTQRDSNP